MRIGELARTNAVSTATVRYYEEIGLLDPPPRTASGYRDFGEGAASTLGFIRSAQGAGLSLDEIRTIIGISTQGDAPCGHVAQLIDRKVETIAAKITALQAAKSELEALSTRARTLARTPCPDGSICHILAP
ncbi:MAG: heavy metal-responsive transcriptional regulator [Actinomycetia bacterium]|nr:heavy metal-responsive transcriptional regulator [Actinomycetes bacterium]